MTGTAEPLDPPNPNDQDVNELLDAAKVRDSQVEPVGRIETFEHEEYKQTIDSPDFILKAHDVFAPVIIEAWILMAEQHNVNPDKITRARKHLDYIRRYQRARGYKLPD